MMSLKFIPALMIVFLAAVPVIGQQDSGKEMSIEESYLQEAIELMIIRETSRTDSREQKLIALEYIGNIIDRGNTSDEIRTTLEFLALEGTQNRANENKRLVNDYPDVRREAARHLGRIGTEEAKSSLIRICTVEKEPLVLQEAVRSLGSIGLNDNDDTLNTIVWLANRNHNSKPPDNVLALYVVNTLDMIAQKNKSITPEAFLLLINISEGSYAPPVKQRAGQVLQNLRNYIAEGMSEQNR